MTFRQLEENINKWSLELEDMEKVFLNQATMVNAWDQMLIKNGAKIVSLNESVAAVRTDQQRLEHELDFVASQLGKHQLLHLLASGFHLNSHPTHPKLINLEAS